MIMACEWGLIAGLTHDGDNVKFSSLIDMNGRQWLALAWRKKKLGFIPQSIFFHVDVAVKVQALDRTLSKRRLTCCKPCCPYMSSKLESYIVAVMVQ